MQRLYNTEDAAGYLGMSRRIFDKQVGPFVPYLVIGRSGRRYDRSDLDTWVEHQVKLVLTQVSDRHVRQTEGT
jgi:hypothetical protein